MRLMRSDWINDIDEIGSGFLETEDLVSVRSATLDNFSLMYDADNTFAHNVEIDVFDTEYEDRNDETKGEI